MSKTYYTDYPLLHGEEGTTPLREVYISSYDGDKYVTIETNGKYKHYTVKSGYIYVNKDKEPISRDELNTYKENT